MIRRKIEAVYPLSPMQQGMLFHSVYAPHSGVYIEQFCCVLRGRLEVSSFERAWQQVVERHSILRTAFSWKSSDKMLQVINRQVEIPLEQEDWSALSPEEAAPRLAAFLKADRERGFELSKAPLIRLALLKTSEDVYQFVWTYHHLLLDGWSLSVLLKEVFSFYEAFRIGQSLRLEPARPYRDYIVWLQRQNTAETEAFWQRTLKGFTAPTPLVVDRAPSNTTKETGYEIRETQLSREQTAKLQSLVRQHQLTLNTLLQGAWALLLSRYSGEEDVVFGAIVSGRPAELAGVEAMVGLFINTLPVRARVQPEASLLAWLQELQAQQAEMRQYEHSSLVQIQGWSEVPRGLPLFESLLVFENYPVDASLREHQWSLTVQQVRALEQINYPLAVVSGPGDELVLKILYDRSRFDPETIRRMLGHLRILLEAIAANPHQRISTLPLLSEAEREQLLVEWNQTQTAYPVNATLLELFAAQAAQRPDAVAVVCEETQLSYRELNHRANQLAHHLRRRGVGAETLVGLCLERSAEMVIGLLGVLKAGGAYLPLDPTYPSERLAFMLADAKASVVLTQARWLDRLPVEQAETLCLDTDWELIEQESGENPASSISADQLAYVIYTSGSTGLPKGVEIEHGSLLNLICWHQQAYRVSSEDRATQLASLGFDASAWELWPYLTAGASIYLPDDETRANPAQLRNWLITRGITISFLPTPLAESVIRLDWPAKVALRKLLTGGDKLHHYPASSLPFEVWNNYGPTENTVVATYCLVRPREQSDAAPPIGQPISNTQVYILDAHLQPVPVGVPGELYIGGASLARGYLNRPELTAEKFIPCPFSAQPAARLYQTSDLARYLPDGSIEFLGRLDQQVKVRGFRIELGEIESVLRQHPGVQQAVVVAREVAAGEKRLVAYLVAKGEAQLNAVEMRDFLQRKLPEHMAPSAFCVLEALPLTPNGKVDRRALPASDGIRPELEAAYVAPRTPVEEVLVGLWAKALDVERVGIYDNFFELGGHSLLATRLVSRIQEAFKVEVPIRALFETPTVAGLAQRLEEIVCGAPRRTAPPIQPIPRDEELPLSFAQQRLWFLNQLEPGSPFYNNPAAVYLTGQLNVAAFERSLNEIVRRHEALRTRFTAVKGRPRQIVAPELRLSVPRVDLRHLPESEREQEALRLVREEAQKPFELTNGPLLRVRLWQLREEEYVALLVMHHIISDGWSNGVLIQELATLYRAFSTDSESPLLELTIQYADFAHWQRQWLRDEVLERQIAYWRKQLSSIPPALALPTDRPRPAVQSFRGAHYRFVLPEQLTEKLKSLSCQEGATLFMTLLAAFQTLLHRYTGQEDISVGTPIANRTRVEIENLIGFFVNTLVMRTDLSGDPSFRELLKRVREVALGAYAHQDLPFEMLVEELQPQRDLSHTPLFQVMLALNNAPTEMVELPGLSIRPVEAESGTARFDLTLEMMESSEGLRGSLEYNTDLFDVDTIARMVGHFQQLLESIATDPAQALSLLPMLSDAEGQQLLVEWNQTAADYPQDRCIHHLFESQVVQRPEAPALIFEEEQLTYRQLNRRANQLAHYLQKLGVGPDTLVGICIERSIEMIVGLLGVLKAGGAYLPLDPTYPAERLAFMLSDSRVPVLLVQERLVERLRHADSGLQNQNEESAFRHPLVICLDADWEQMLGESEQNPTSSVTPESLAYCIYTSGSTGQPKGVMLPHRGLSNLAVVQRRAFNIDAGGRILQFAPFSFDASVWEIFMALSSGATLCLARQESLASMEGLHRLLEEQRITTVTLPPSVLARLSAEELPELKTVIAAGESCPVAVVKRWAPGRRFFNAYGPTETTVCASLARCDESAEGNPPIGRPIANTEVYVLDKRLQPVPIGVPGELHIGGVTLAREYLNRPELTAEKFIRLRIADGGSRIEEAESHSGLRWYKTGDLVRYRPDGNVEFLGRIDHQVKIRGFRVELGEIETVLSRQPGVAEAVVVAREDEEGDKQLVAYVVTAEEAELNGAEVRSALRQQLPEYMVPVAFVQLEAMPLAPSGKVDRAALPAPSGMRSKLAREYLAPRTETERKLAEIWAELLKLDRVGVHDDFFDLGGHSLLATQLVSRVQEAFQVELPLRTLFELPTIAAVAERIEAAMTAELPDSDKIARLLERMEQLSEDEVKAMLDEKELLVQTIDHDRPAQTTQ